jgi:hypothetical protein
MKNKKQQSILNKMKNTLLIALAIVLSITALRAQSSITMNGLQFEFYDKTSGSSSVIKFTSNTQAMYIMSGVLPISGKSYRDDCPCKCTVSGNKITINCVCADREVYPDPITDAFEFDSKARTLTSTRYKYTNDSAPSSDLAWKFHVWKQK